MFFRALSSSYLFTTNSYFLRSISPFLLIASKMASKSRIS